MIFFSRLEEKGVGKLGIKRFSDEITLPTTHFPHFLLRKVEKLKMILITSNHPPWRKIQIMLKWRVCFGSVLYRSSS